MKLEIRIEETPDSPGHLKHHAEIEGQSEELADALMSLMIAEPELIPVFAIAVFAARQKIIELAAKN